MSQLCPAELDILQALSVLQLNPSMTPQLRALHWSGSHLLYVNLFVGPLLQAFRLDPSCDAADGDAATTLANVIHSSPDIEDVNVNNLRGQQTSRTLATLDSTSWNKLRTLNLRTSTSPEFVPILGRLPVLDSLKIKFGQSATHPNFKARLTLLSAFVADLALIPVRVLLGAGSTPRLTELSLIMENDVPTAASLQECFMTLSTGNHPAVKDITASTPLPPSPDMLDFQATLSTIQPLFAFKGLIFLFVELPFMLDDAELLVLTKAWPSLETLDLGGRGQWFFTRI